MKNEVSSSSSSSSPHRSVVVFNKKTNVHIKWIFCMLINNLKLHFPWCTEQPTNPADRIWRGGASGQKLQQNVLTRSFRVFLQRRRICWTSTARPGPGSGSARLSQQASFSRQSLVLLDVILLETHGDPLSHLQVLLQARLGAARLKHKRLWGFYPDVPSPTCFRHPIIFFYLLGLHVSCGEVSDAVHEAVLRHLVVRPQKLLKLNTGNRHGSENGCRAATQQNNLRDDREGSEVQVWEEISSNRF